MSKKSGPFYIVRLLGQTIQYTCHTNLAKAVIWKVELDCFFLYIHNTYKDE